MKARLAIATAMLLSASVASGQVCTGGPGRDAGAVQLGGGYSSAKSATEIIGAASGIGERAYGRAFVGSVAYDELSGSTTVLGGTAGYQVPVGSTGRTQLCPYATLSLGFGPNDIEGTGIDASSTGFDFGVSLGHEIPSSSEISVIPFAAANFSRSTVKLSLDGDSESTSDSHVSIGFGVGIVINKQFAVRPQISIPVGAQDSDPVVGIGFSLALGNKQ